MLYVFFEQKSHYCNTHTHQKANQKFHQDSLHFPQRKRIEEEDLFPVAMKRIILHPRLYPI